MLIWSRCLSWTVPVALIQNWCFCDGHEAGCTSHWLSCIVSRQILLTVTSVLVIFACQFNELICAWLMRWCLKCWLIPSTAGCQSKEMAMLWSTGRVHNKMLTHLALRRVANHMLGKLGEVLHSHLLRTTAHTKTLSVNLIINKLSYCWNSRMYEIYQMLSFLHRDALPSLYCSCKKHPTMHLAESEQKA